MPVGFWLFWRYLLACLSTGSPGILAAVRPGRPRSVIRGLTPVTLELGFSKWPVGALRLNATAFVAVIHSYWHIWRASGRTFPRQAGRDSAGGAPGRQRTP